ncbi:MAG: autotransporter outer membrane beta-barrel domain-containing protein [Cyclobacteriaceae bacterium]|nr:autotransporter outer membrane beta-barrel domain-containing protein [Cyclobacteriaceae bacterium]
MKNRIVYFIPTLLLCFHLSIAQEEQKQRPAFLDKMYIGGGFGAGFGDYTFVSVSPIIGYHVTPRLSTGVRLMYQYTTFDYNLGNRRQKYKGNDYGAGLFARQMLFGPVFLQAEYEYLNFDGLYSDGTQRREDFNSFLAGGGISQPIGRNAFFFLTALYNFSYDRFDKSNSVRLPYDSPIVLRVGITAGF